MTAAVQTEIERKYTVSEGTVLPDLGGVTGVATAQSEDPFELEAVYYDTDGLDLARARIALRRRVGGHDEGWHLKLPADEGRTEMQWPLGDGASVPAAVLEPVRALVRDRELTPLARIATTRTITELVDGSGAVVVEIADDAVTASDARGGTVRAWREWEAELGPAAPDTPEGREALLDEVEAVLLAAGATVSESVSKLAQALGRTGLGIEGVDGGAGEAASSAEDPAAAVVLDGIRELVERLVGLDPAARRDDPDAVHDMRTTVRRLRNVLATHRGLLGRERVEPLRLQLSRLGGQLGEVRDLEVRAEWAEEALEGYERDRGVVDEAARRRLVGDVLEERAAALDRLRQALSSEPYFRLLDDLEEFAGQGPAAGTGGTGGSTGSAGKAARAEEKRVVKRATRRTLRHAVPLEEAEGSESDDIVRAAEAFGALHESRKSARRLRHVAEFATSGAGGVLGGKTARLGELAEDLQDALGDHRDATLFGEHLLLLAGRAHAAGEDSFVYGVLYQRSLDRAADALVAADRARRALARRA